jgi:hypothetical protein
MAVLSVKPEPGVKRLRHYGAEEPILSLNC